jgi:hypothetical protein
MATRIDDLLCLSASDDWHERARAARALAQVNELAFVSHVLRRLLDDRDMAVIEVAAKVLLARGDLAGARLVFAAVSNPDAGVGEHVMDVMRERWRRRGTSLEQLCTQALCVEPDELVRHGAAEALARLRHDCAPPS